MSSGLYTHTTRATGTILTASIYNADHQNHITNQNPAMTGALADTLTEYRSTADPGGSGSESLPGSLAAEIQRIRYVLSRIVGKTYWYEAPATNLQTAGAALDSDLTAIAALASTGYAVRTAANTWAQRTFTVSGTGIAITNPAGIAGNTLITIDPAAIVAAVGTIPSAATQADQETGTDTAKFVTPGRQKFHPGSAKFWALVTVTGGVPAITVSYNVASITDVGAGRLTISFTTAFSSANYCVSSNSDASVTTDDVTTAVSARLAGSVTLTSRKNTSTADPDAWNVIGYGDQ